VRSKLGIIAQDPILLSGTLRLNLDIDGQSTDQELYDVLRQVQLIGNTENGTSIDGGESNSEENSLQASTLVEGKEGVNIFENLDSEIRSGGEK